MVRKTICSFGGFVHKVIDQNIPLNVLFEVTYKCNERCGHCYVSPESKPELTTSEVRRILDQLAEAGSLFLTLTGGEPFMRPDIFDIASYARQKGFALRFFTNGILITPQIADEIASLNVTDVGISLYGAKSSTHEAITRVAGSFKRSLKAFRLLRERNIKTVFKFTLMKQNFHEFEAVGALAEKLGAYFSSGFFVSPKTNGSKETLVFRMGDEELRHILENEFIYPKEIIRKKRETKLTEKEVGERILCSAGRDICSVSPYGDLQPCIMLPLKVGNLREASFESLWWSSKELIYWRSLHHWNLTACSQCSSWGRCFRCSGLALLEDGDLLGVSELACKIEELEKSVGINS